MHLQTNLDEEPQQKKAREFVLDQVSRDIKKEYYLLKTSGRSTISSQLYLGLSPIVQRLGWWIVALLGT